MINFNTNILDTNIINLSFVIGVLFYFGGDVLNSLLEDRLSTILKSLEEVKTLKLNLKEIENQNDPSFDSLAEDLNKIKTDLSSAVERMKLDIKERYTKEILDLELGKLAKISFEEEKANSQIAEKIKYLTIELSVLQVENRVLKAQSETNLGLIATPDLSDPFNRSKNYGFFFKHALNNLSSLKVNSNAT
jgi:F-type H+-transporting ATPase subunit b